MVVLEATLVRMVQLDSLDSLYRSFCWARQSGIQTVVWWCSENGFALLRLFQV